MSSVSTISDRQKIRLRFGIQLFLWGMALSMSTGLINGVIKRYEVPAWLCILLALIPLGLLLAALRVQKKALEHADELARHITRDAFAFAFYALLGLFIAVDLLRSGGVLPDFVWNSKTLMVAMGAMLAIGYGWSSWRYR